MFGFWDKVEQYVSLSLVDGGVDLWISYGFLLCAWLLSSIGLKLYVKLKSKK